MQIDTRVLQTRLLYMLKQFHKVCVDNELTYFLTYGTMLGAIRHSGFIPWDDVDIVMPREDYNRFKSNSVHMLPDNLEIMFYENRNNSPMHYIKLIDNRTTLIEDKYRDYYEGVYIDVFPLDGVPEKKTQIKIKQKKTHMYQSLIVNHCYTDGRKGIRKLYGQLAKRFDLERLHKKLEKELTQYAYSSSNIVGSYLGAYGIREFVPKEIMGIPAKYTFEDAEFYGLEDYDSYLRCLYGDYMELPPIDKRNNKHQYFYVNLDKPYREYQSEHSVAKEPLSVLDNTERHEI